MIKYIVFLFLFFSQNLYSYTKFTAEISSNEIEIDSNKENNILVFGTFDANNGKNNIIITIKSPKTDIIIKKKIKKFGLWIAIEQEKIQDIRGFFHIYAAKDNNLNKQISNFDFPEFIKNPNNEFFNAFVEKNMKKKFFAFYDDKIEIKDEILYKLKIDLEKDIPLGNYEINIYLYNDENILETRKIYLDIKSKKFSENITYIAEKKKIKYFSICLGIIILAIYINNILLK